MKKIIKTLVAISLGSFALFSCSNQDDQPSQISDYDTVVTKYEPNMSDQFGTAKTFSMPNYVTHPGKDSVSNPVVNPLDEVILAEAKSQMEMAGYQYVDPNTGEEADLVVLPYGVEVTYVGTWNMYDYWGGYWWNYWGWYGYPPYYGYPVSGVYTFSQGSVILEIVDNRAHIQEGGDEKIPVLWQGIINGTQSNTIDDKTRVEDGIQQMFIQSPYIQSK
ncbi:DUF4136 domain-containing protein [Flammeovirga yaeyamensis]|uniref:DUF4136 domain-containing protein n=1 Tax=Flammeovirga yaeyamensis TaxID=367791 RepID=A0AAX1N7X7_9BACT|nr:DUF4136 domain-containing protein [Flammeovirga yaeyamensis]MBB3701040.1 hypothetical protein [Flammeovirga yaeyamensis]NMF38127.1 DUF4136 domain-containing protein [Flammeovirga yaeyamensis]QWG01898.1 DUF4136 domain-containing protein [Flammeovirga yaeyamensis]